MSDNATIDPNKLLIWIHTWYGRDELRQPTLDSLDASDAAGRYEIMRQPEGMDRDDFYMQTLRSVAGRTDIQWMLRLEDDTLVSKYLVHNACRWKAVDSSHFGAGWLSVTRALLSDMDRIRWVDGFRVREAEECHFAGGVLMRTSFLASAMDRIKHRLRTHPAVRDKRRFAPGCALSNAVWRSGLRVFFHEPSIVCIDLSVPAYHRDRYPTWTQPYNATWRTG